MKDDALFGSAGTGAASPLADRMRPVTLDDVIGQDHIVGEGRLLRRAIQLDRLSSVIFYGPPGTGKTSLARVIANSTKAVFESLNAVLSGIKDIREAIERSSERLKLYSRRTILFVDEVHRWNKAQQDALLPWVENGTVILVGATTENPFFEVNRALVSRSRVFQLKALTKADLMTAAKRALCDAERGYGKWRVSFEEGALEHLVEVAGGDARSLLNALELAVETSDWEGGVTGGLPPVEGGSVKRAERVWSEGGGFPPQKKWPPPDGAEIYISMACAEESIQRRVVLYDKDGDYHFDTISAFIKSVRGSDPDAALYWMAKMVAAGEDPSFIFRRMIILASEDVGLADPRALEVVIACASAFDRIGFPEGNFPLAHACLYLASAPKSNSTLGFFDALKVVRESTEASGAEVPNHLRDPSRDGDSFGHGEGYVYPHAYRDHWTAQQYLPSVLQGKLFYTPSHSGYEGRIRAEVLRKREAQAAVLLDEASRNRGEFKGDGEVLSWQMEAKGAEGWYRRLQSGRSRVLLEDRDALFDAARLKRHSRVLIANAGDGLLLWESFRRAPEGLTCGIVKSAAEKDALLKYAASLSGGERPVIEPLPFLPVPEEARRVFGSSKFDAIFARELWRGEKNPREAFRNFALAARELLAEGGAVFVIEPPPYLGQRLSDFVMQADKALSEKLSAAEEAFFSESGASRWSWREDSLKSAFEQAGFSVELSLLERKEERVIGDAEIAQWFKRESSPWGAFMFERLGEADFNAVLELLKTRAKDGPFVWKWKTALAAAEG